MAAARPSWGRLEYLFIGTESYSKLIHAFAHSHGVELGEFANLEPAANILDLIAKQKGKVNP